MTSIRKCRENHKDKNDVYDIGVILLEMIVGRTLMSENDVEVTKDIVSFSGSPDLLYFQFLKSPILH